MDEGGSGNNYVSVVSGRRKRVDVIYTTSEPCEAVILPCTFLQEYLQHDLCHDKNNSDNKLLEETKVFTRYDLIKLYLFCGVKQYWVDRVVERAIYELIQECTQLDEEVLTLTFNNVKVTENEQEQQMKSLEEQSLWNTKKRNGVMDVNQKYVIVIQDSRFNAVCARVLRLFLRGQFITLYSLYRWEVAQEVTLQRQLPLIILCGGTSGSGKSTLAALIASQLHISLIVSTDTIRQVLRTQYAQNKARSKEYKILSASSYDPVEIEEVTEEYNSCKLESERVSIKTDYAIKQVNFETSKEQNCHNKNYEEEKEQSAKVKERVSQHYFEQCSYILPVLHRIIAQNVEAGISMVVEGVHLHPRYMAQVQQAVIEHNTRNNDESGTNKTMKKGKAVCVAVLLRIAKEERHRERFAIRAKSMSLSPQLNKYVAKFDNIRTIQEILEREVEKIQINEKGKKWWEEQHHQLSNYKKSSISTLSNIISINNTNVDKSWMILHCRILSLLESYKLAEHDRAKRHVDNKIQNNISFKTNAHESLSELEEQQHLEHEQEDCSENRMHEEVAYSNLSSKKALLLLHEQKRNKQRSKRKSALHECTSIEQQQQEQQEVQYEEEEQEEESQPLLETQNAHCTNITIAKQKLFSSAITTNTGNRTISVPAHITFRCAHNGKVKNRNSNTTVINECTNGNNEESVIYTKSTRSNKPNESTKAYDEDDKENCHMHVSSKCTYSQPNICNTSSRYRSNTLLMHRPLTRSRSQGMFTESTQRGNEVSCDELCHYVYNEEMEMPSLTNSINEHVHLSLSSVI